MILTNFLNRSNYGKSVKPKKRFFYYCIYAFGLPIVIASLAFIADESKIIPGKYKIGMTTTGCFINGNRVVKLIYMYFPIGFLLFLNFVYYSATAIKIFKVQKEFDEMQKNDCNRHSRSNLEKTRYPQVKWMNII